MMGKKSDENSRALALNETVGENYSPTSMAVSYKKRLIGESSDTIFPIYLYKSNL
jgi:hypothetical protein